MKNYLLIIILFTFISCSSTDVKPIKPKPSGGEWKQCHLCYGTGEMKTHYYGKQSQEERDRDLDEDLGCCLNIFTLFSDKADDYKDNLNEEDINSYYSEDLPEEKYVKCNYCNGSGWINKYKKESKY